MEAAVIDWSEISASDTAISIVVELAESLVDKFLASLIGHASHSDEELVVVNTAVLVGIETLDENFTLTLCDVHSQVLDAPVELLLIELPVAIVIDDTEGPSHSTDGLSAAGSKSSTNFGDN